MDETAQIEINKYKAIIMSASAAIMTIVPPNWKYSFANPTAIKMFSVKDESEFITLDPWTLSPEKQPDGRNSQEKAIEMLEIAVRDGFYTFQWLHKRLHGEEFYTQVLLTKVGDGDSMFVNAIVTDISEQKKMELLLKKSEERLQTAQRVAEVGNWELNLETKKIWASEEAFRIYGIARISEEISLEEVHQRALPEYRVLLDTAMQELISGQKDYNVEFQIARQNDGVIRHIHSKAELLKNSSGIPISVLGVIQDITDTKNAQSSLKESQLILQNIIDLLPVRIFWKDTNLHYLGCNTAFAKDAGEQSPKDIIGKDDTQMSWKDQADLYRKDDMSVITSGKSKLNYEEPQTTPTGGTIWLITNKMPLTDNTNKTIGVLGTYHDITAMKSTETELKMKNKELEELNSSMVNRELKMIELKEKIAKLEASQ